VGIVATLSRATGLGLTVEGTRCCVGVAQVTLQAIAQLIVVFGHSALVAAAFAILQPGFWHKVFIIVGRVFVGMTLFPEMAQMAWDMTGSPLVVTPLLLLLLLLRMGLWLPNVEPPLLLFCFLVGCSEPEVFQSITR
jgi:hypothetical protein